LVGKTVYSLRSITRIWLRLFGEAKNVLSVVRLSLRSLAGARDEFLLTATVQNLKRLARHATIPPPRPMLA